MPQYASHEPRANSDDANDGAPTTRVVGVRFRPTGRVYYYDPGGADYKSGQWVIVESPKGTECGRVVIAPRQIESSELGADDLKPILRIATEDDLRQMLAYKSKEKGALRRCAERIEQRELPMKLVESEYTYDGGRLTFYFTAEERVDFRALVRDLAAQFHTRIELRQIGARDHAKLLGGVGMCGKTLCCSSWLTEFNVVSIKMAKEQGLPLNTSKISGLCGRLMCCLAYENDDYIEAKEEMPAYNEVVTTGSGPGRVVGVNVPRESVEVMLESGATITVPVRQLDGYAQAFAQRDQQREQARTATKTATGGCGKPNCRHGQHARPAAAQTAQG